MRLGAGEIYIDPTRSAARSEGLSSSKTYRLSKVVRHRHELMRERWSP